jgi:hypothetical protein
MKKIILYINLILIVSFINSCEDPVPNDYTPDNIVEAILIVDEPIQNITVMRSQPLDIKFNYDSSMIKDANVVITGDGQDFVLKYRTREDGKIGYYFADTNYKVKPQIEYKLKITLNDGKVITGSTVTPSRTEWSFPPKDFYQFPLDTIKLPATDSIGWKKVPSFEFYLVSIKNLDTLNYGSYLTPATGEMNRRIDNGFRSERFFRETAVINPIPNVRTSVVWNVFKWYGKHELAIYVPDFNLLRWYLQAQTKGEADPLLTSVKGGIGYFGSASIIRHNFFLLKNQP